MTLTELILVLGLAALVLGGCASTDHTGISHARVPDDIPDDWVHFTRPAVAVGDPAPDFTLPRDDGSGAVTLSEMRGLPVVLVFGSFT